MRRAFVLLGCGSLVAALTRCAAAPPNGLPADTVVVTSTGMWLLMPWQPAIPSFGDEGARAAPIRKVFELPGGGAPIAIVDSQRRPIRPVSDGWERLTWRLHRCAALTPTPECGDPLAGTVFSGPGGLVLHISDRAWLDSLRRRRPSFLYRRASREDTWVVVDSAPVRYTP